MFDCKMTKETQSELLKKAAKRSRIAVASMANENGPYLYNLASDAFYYYVDGSPCIRMGCRWENRAAGFYTYQLIEATRIISTMLRNMRRVAGEAVRHE